MPTEPQSTIKLEIRRPIVGMLLLAIGLFSLIFFLSVFLLYWDHTQAEQDRVVSTFQSHVTKSIDNEVILYERVMRNFMQNPAFIYLTMQQDRHHLEQKVVPIYQQLQTHLGITHFYFHTPEGINLFRAHKPDRYGDPIQRFTLQQAIKLRRVSHGIELGPLGTLTLRVVVPWQHNGKIIGYLEMGKELNHLLKTHGHLLPFDYYAYIYKRFLDQDSWLKGMQMMHRDGQWSKLSDMVYTGEPQQNPPDDILSFIETNQEYSASIWDLFSHGQHHVFIKFPVYDSSNSQVGIIVASTDDTSARNRNQIHLMAVFGTFLLLMALLILFFNRFSRKIEYRFQSLTQDLQSHQKILDRAQSVAKTGHWEWSIKSNTLYWSDGVYQLFGLDPQQQKASNRLFLRHVHPDDRQSIKLAVDRAIQNPDVPYTIEHRIIQPDGTVRTLHEVGEVITNRHGQPVQILGTAHDITDRKELEDETQRAYYTRIIISSLLETALDPLSLKKQLRKALSIIFSLPWLKVQQRGAIFLFDPQDQKLHLAAHLNLEKKLQEQCSELELGHCLCGQAAQQRTLLFRQHVDQAQETEYRGMSDYGHYCAPILYQDDLLGVLNLYLKRGHKPFPEEESVIHTITQTLAALIHEKRREQHLIQAKDAAEAGNRVKDSFLGIMSHELRTPMNAILGTNELLRKTQTTQEQSELLVIQEQSGAALLALIDDILDLSLSHHHNPVISHDSFNLEDLLLSIHHTLQQQAEQKGLTLIFPPSNRMKQNVYGDLKRLRQILLHLLGNAIKFTPDGEVELSVPRHSPPFNTLKLSIRDTGIGIAPHQHEHIFEPFVQGDASFTRLYGGSGIGLSIVKRLLDAMDGTLQLESTPGSGSMFTITLPQTEPHQLSPLSSSAEIHHSVQSSPHTARNILYAEDNKENALLVDIFLRKTPHKLTIVGDGAQAVDAVKTGAFDLVLMDIQMPVMDGYQATQEIRKWEKQSNRSAMPILALTAHALDKDVQKSLKMGCNNHLTKPITKQRLLDALLNT
ncbi:ATP-binding protein [Magnetococcus sp. PR-3]|uniref:ATP-binding protein n=1 Tax=Magnetococcus sp. PR-3 TaxID=3120355 RepID=UPI002FCE5832